MAEEALMADDAPPVAPSASTASLDALRATINTALGFWAPFALERRRAALDRAAAALEDARNDSVARRKALAAETKRVRKLAPPERAAASPALVKAYQGEIDQLAARARRAEDAFGELYRSLAQAPDPADALDRATSLLDQAARVKQLEREQERTARALAEYREEHRGLEDQAVTVAKLQKRIKVLENEVEQRAEQRAETREAEAALALERTEERARVREAELRRRVERAEATSTALRRQHDEVQSQLFDATAARDKERAALRAERDLLAAELEKRAASEAQLRLELASAKGSGDAESGAAERRELERQLQQREDELAASRDTQYALERRLESEMQRYHDKLTALTTEQRAAMEKATALQSQLDSAPSRREFDALQHRINLLRELGYDIDNDAPPGSTSNVKSSATENVLREQLRQRESAAAAAHVAQADAERRATEAESKLSEMKEERDGLVELVRRLEADLAVRLADVDAADDPSDELSQLRYADDDDDDDDNGDMGDNDEEEESRRSSTTSDANKSTKANSKNSSLLRVVCAQRDRLQQRIVDLEAECASLQSAREHAVDETKQLRSDNVTLFEKIRYLESYSAELPARRREVAAAAEARYKPLYEERVSPFAQFASAERARQVSQLSGVERVVMWFSRFFLRSKISRMFLFVYMTLMHVLFLVLLNRYSTCFPLSRADNLEKPHGHI